MEDIERYKGIIREIENYYNNNKYYIFLEFKYLSMPTMEINFSNDFVINNKQERFIDYDYEQKKFTLSLNGGLKRYNELKTRVVQNKVDVKRKYSTEYYKTFSLDDQAQIINFYNKNFNEMCYSEFLQAYVKKLIDITSNDTFVVEDFLEEYKERVGSFFNDVLAEVKTREIAKNRGFFYLPEIGYNNEILKEAKFMIANPTLWRVILTSDIKTLMLHLSIIQSNKIKKYEDYCFEKKYKLPAQYFSEKEEEKLLYKSIKARKQELKNKLKMFLNTLVGDGSLGYVNILALFVWYIVVLALGYFVTKLLLGS